MGKDIKCKIYMNKNEVIQVAATLILSAIIIFPLFLLARYATPSADDFTYGYQIMKATQSGPAKVSDAVFNTIYSFYFNWQGTYFSTLVASLSPFALFGINYVKFGIYVLITLFCALHLLFIRLVLTRYFMCKKWSVTLWVYTAFLFLTTQFLPLTETLYWHNSAAVYTIPYLTAVLGLCFFIFAYKNDRFSSYVLLVPCLICFCAACGGALLISAFLFMVFFFLLLRSFYYKQTGRKRLKIIYALLVILIFSFVNGLAPGNKVRWGVINTTGYFSFSKLLYGTVNETVEILTAIIPIVMLMGVMILIFSATLPYVKRNTKKPTLTHILFIYSLLTCFMCVGPIIWGYSRTNNDFPTRYTTTSATIFIGLAILWSVYLAAFAANNYYTQIDWLRKRALLLGSVIFVIGIALYPVASWNNSKILRSYDTGILTNHYATIFNTLNEIKNSAEANVAVAPLDGLSDMLKPLNLSEDPSNWINKAVAKWYDKKSVYIVPNNLK